MYNEYAKETNYTRDPQEETNACGKFDNCENTESKLFELFSNDIDTLNKLMEMIDTLQTRDNWQTLEDLPSEWWQHQGGNTGNTEGITSIDAQNMTGAVQQMPNAVAKALNGLTVRMDGQAVGYIVAPYVSQQIAAQIGG